jgi:translation initiation factor IF-3
VTHPERGVMILDRLAEELADYGVVEQRPIQDGRNMTMMLGPSKAVLSGEIGQTGDAAAPADEDAAAAADAPDSQAPDSEAPETDVPEATAPEAAAAAEADSTA